MSAPEVAALKSVSREAVARAIKEGRLPAFRVGRFYAIRRADAQAWKPTHGGARIRKEPP